MLNAQSTPAFQSLRHEDPEHARTVLVDWMLGNRCNFACDYCPSALHDGSIPWISIADAEDFLTRLKRHYMDGLGRAVWLQLTGGEPTQYPRFFDLIKSAHAHGMKVAVVSNGSRTARFWEKAAPVLTSAILTYHDLQVDHAAFLTTAAMLATHDVPLHINITVHPDRFDDVMARAHDIAEQAPNASITLKPLRVGFGDQLYPYSETQLAQLSTKLGRSGWSDGKTSHSFQKGRMVLSEYGAEDSVWRANDLMLEGRNSWLGMRCDAGLESLRVSATGAVRRAVCGVGGELGMLGGPIAFPVVSVKCTKPRCACVADILITKTRPRDLKPTP